MRMELGKPPVHGRFQHAFLASFLGVVLVGVGCAGDPAVRKQQYLESGNRYFEQQKYAEAIIEYRNAISLDATFGQARKQLAESYLRSGNRGAFGEFVRAADLLPADLDVQLTAGSLLLLARKPEEALARADAALKIQPENIDALVLRGNALAGLTSYDEALKSIEQAIQIDPKRGASYTDLGLVQVAQGRRDEAEVTLRRAATLSPDLAQTHLALGNFYWSSGKVKEAGQAFDRALKVDPKNLAANRFMASFKYSTGQPEQAEPYVRRVADSSESPEGKFGLVDYYLSVGRAKDAIATLEPMQKTPAVQLRLARALDASGDLAKAKSMVDEVLKADSKNADAQLLKGQLLWKEGRRDDAFTAIQTANTLAPSSVNAQFTLGRMYVARGDNAAAQAAFREVLRINPRATAAQIELASLQAQSSPHESVQTAEGAARTDPTSLPARLTLVRNLITARDLTRAEREMARLRADHPGEAAVHVEDARLAIVKNNVTAARAALERADKLDPESDATLPLWLAVDLREKNSNGVRIRLEERLKKRAANPEVLLLAGRTYLAINDPAAAEKALRAAIELDPARNEPYELLGNYYVRQKKLDEAILEFEALSKKQARPVGALTMTGMLLEQQGKTDAAMKRYEDVLALDSRAGVAANNLAWILADRGQDLDKALQLAQTAVAAYPETPQILDTLGWVYYKKDQPTLAVPLFQECVKRAPAVPGYHYHLGLALLKTGDATKGRAALQRALDAKPDATLSAEIRRALESAN